MVYGTGEMRGCANQDLQVYDKRGGLRNNGNRQNTTMDGNATLLSTFHTA